MKEAYRVFRLLSLDIVAGSVIGAALFSKILEVEIDTSTYLLLATAVWLVYTADHLLDSVKANPGSRHYFYYQYRKVLTAVAMGLLVLSVILLQLQPWIIIRNGLFLAFLVILHLVGASRLNLFRMHLKEFSCALLYTIGIVLPAFSVSQYVDLSFIAVAIFYLCSAWLNLLTISIYEAGYDKNNGFDSLATTMGLKSTNLIAVIILGLSFLLVLFAMRWMEFSIQLGTVLLLMFLTQGVILGARKTFITKDRYRIYGDLVYVIPVLYLW
jgi:4-hydroxybenzoate polyprenyltransferase